MSGTAHVVRHALIAYGFSNSTADKLIDELVNGHIEVPVETKRYGVMEAKEWGWVAWDRLDRVAADSGYVWATLTAAEARADQLNAREATNAA